MPEFLETPLDGKGVMTNPFGIDYAVTGAVAWAHGGRDLAAFEGAPVYALVDGPLILHPWHTWGDGSYGNVVKQATTDGWFTLCGHLSGYASDVYDGQIVQAGKRVGYQGHTGYTRPAGLGGSHVHWGLCRVPSFPKFGPETKHQFADPFAYLISEGDRMAIFQKLEQLEQTLGQFVGGPGDLAGTRMAAWVNGGNIGLLDCLGPMPADLVNFPAVKAQAYALNDVLTAWRPALMAANPGLVLP